MACYTKRSCQRTTKVTNGRQSKINQNYTHCEKNVWKKLRPTKKKIQISILPLLVLSVDIDRDCCLSVGKQIEKWLIWTSLLVTVFSIQSNRMIEKYKKVWITRNLPYLRSPFFHPQDTLSYLNTSGRTLFNFWNSSTSQIFNTPCIKTL